MNHLVNIPNLFRQAKYSKILNISHIVYKCQFVVCKQNKLYYLYNLSLLNITINEIYDPWPGIKLIKTQVIFQNQCKKLC